MAMELDNRPVGRVQMAGGFGSRLGDCVHAMSVRPLCEHMPDNAVCRWSKGC